MNTTLKTILVALLGCIGFYSCTLEEDPRFPSSEVLFSDLDGANTVLNGAYAGMADFNYKGADFMHLTYLGSGMYNSNKASDLPEIISGNPYPSLNYVENLWAGCYRVIARTNDVISGLENINLGDKVAQDNIIGQAYFLRAYTYFDLIRTYGAVPMPLQPATLGNINLPRSPVSDVYAQIISDASKAATLLPEPGQQTAGRPARYAANMLLAKVYMQLAESSTTPDYWKKAWDEAIKVYGKYTMVSNYNALWNISTCNNTTESIFEINGNVEYTLRLHQLFTASNGNIGKSVWGRIKPNIELYDLHAAKYSDDPRLTATFRTQWTKFETNGTETQSITYPTFTTRGNTDKSYPWLNKYYIKDIYAANYNTNMHFVSYRYADLLLMLAEIENELNGPANAFQYVNKVLARARLSGTGAINPKDWSGLSQAQFRDAIMLEYRFELLGEGHDWFNMKRRGWAYFKKNVVDFHNNYTGAKKYDWTKKGDVQFGINLSTQSRLMLMPIPSGEMTANPNITGKDQNPGY